MTKFGADLFHSNICQNIKCMKSQQLKQCGTGTETDQK